MTGAWSQAQHIINIINLAGVRIRDRQNAKRVPQTTTPTQQKESSTCWYRDQLRVAQDPTNAFTVEGSNPGEVDTIDSKCALYCFVMTSAQF